MKGFDGRDHTLGEYRGKLNKVVLLHFSDPAAPGAEDAAADLESLYKDVDHWDVIVVLVAKGKGGDPYHEAQMLKDLHALSYPILVDDDSRAAEAFFVTTWPTTFIIDDLGKVAAMQTGKFDSARIQQLLRPLRRRFP